MATKTKEEFKTQVDEKDDNYGSVRPAVPRKYEPIISVIIVLCAVLVLGFAIVSSGFLD